ncbi:TlpA family protein disulfide reductase [uncultured Algibacter sp.]|uniref:TlpA family protein disulfide reductase n=1 Tax=uncultured Algibacter sp. TaxID=298659 RepID=UPI0026206D74|nr:TlpA family protein disulfide reductase [uncultured Algibacter sp.]
MKITYIFIILFAFLGCKDTKNKDDFAESNNKVTSTPLGENVEAIDLEIYDFSGFKKFLNRRDDKVYVINFWATWCAPCVKELPHFEKLNQQYKKDNVEVILVSLDFPHLYESKLKPYIKEKNIQSKVIALDDLDMNSWIPQVNENWSGSIPATIIYKRENSKFYEQSFNYNELESALKPFLK